MLMFRAALFSLIYLTQTCISGEAISDDHKSPPLTTNWLTEKLQGWFRPQYSASHDKNLVTMSEPTSDENTDNFDEAEMPKQASDKIFTSTNYIPWIKSSLDRLSHVPNDRSRAGTFPNGQSRAGTFPNPWSHTGPLTPHRRRRRWTNREDEEEELEDIEMFPWISPEYILVVRLGVPVTSLNLTSLEDLKKAFAHVLHMSVGNVGIDKIRLQDDAIEMFFIRPGQESGEFAYADLCPANDIISVELLPLIQARIPHLNVTGLQTIGAIEKSVTLDVYDDRVWPWPYIAYMAAACSLVFVLSVGVLVFCCIKMRKKKTGYTTSNITTQQIRMCPPSSPDMKDPHPVQPESRPIYITKGISVPVPAQPPILKSKKKKVPTATLR